MATTTVLYPSPPPTANTLKPHQRSRLMKSTQKLGKILGTTPYLLESSDLPITLLPVGGPRKSAKAPRSVFTHSASSSVSSFGSESPLTSSSISLTSLPSSNGSYDVLPLARPGFSDTKHSRSKEAPTPLVIRLHTVPVSPSNERFASSLPSTPSTAVPITTTKYSFPPTPCTPTFDQSEIRRKRMAKLTRHLGETIPPHLISATPVDSPEADMVSARKRRSMSVDGINAVEDIDIVSELGFSQHKPAVSFCPKPQVQARLTSWVGEWNRDDMQEVQKQLRALR
ncbi:hypothetical protein PILCRDRAFT_827394 [Piloderma croceum F 1598]|uniref:Uncharacterized protein n=1 Tax=Piloderma croceum (strain F 1598) TaxID=765440 RepID=A0A0C3AN17_PILCF|nr:hypothetical protein PILCRDRAFT_827394 [Piloderma croceum F 1598]